MRLSVRLAALTASIALLAACDLSTDPGGALTLEVEVDRTFVWAPEGFTVTVRAINHTTLPVVLSNEGPGCVIGYEITDHRGNVVGPEFGCFAQLTGGEGHLQIERGDTLETTEHVAGFLRWTPGFYNVSGVLYVNEKTHRTAPTEFLLQCRKPEWAFC